VELRVTYLAFTAIKWYTTMVHMASEPRVLAREYRVSWVMVRKEWAKARDCKEHEEWSEPVIATLGSWLS
jgi:hypothetical protein